MNKRFLIVTGGEIEDAFANAYRKLISYDVLLVADHGMDYCYRNQIIPNIIIGDFDSVSEEALAFFKKKDEISFHQLNPVKDDTDTEFAIRYAIANGATEITLLGATGTRLDHVMGNITLLGIGLEEQVPITIVDPHNRIHMIDNSITIEKEKQFGRYISLLPFGGVAEGVTIIGAKYPLENYTIGGFNTLAISNEIVADAITIQVSKGFLVVVESRDTPFVPEEK